MKFLKYAAYTIVGIVLVLLVLGLVLPKSAHELQTISTNGKTVHIVQGDDGPISFSASAEDGNILVNGQKLDLSAGDRFTVRIFSSGRIEMVKGAP